MNRAGLAEVVEVQGPLRVMTIEGDIPMFNLYGASNEPTQSQRIQAELDELNALQARRDQEFLDFIVEMRRGLDHKYDLGPDSSRG